MGNGACILLSVAVCALTLRCRLLAWIRCHMASAREHARQRQCRGKWSHLTLSRFFLTSPARERRFGWSRGLNSLGLEKYNDISSFKGCWGKKNPQWSGCVFWFSYISGHCCSNSCRCLSYSRPLPRRSSSLPPALVFLYWKSVYLALQGNKTHAALMDSTWSLWDLKLDKKCYGSGPCFSDSLCCFPWQQIRSRCWNVRLPRSGDRVTVNRLDLDKEWQFGVGRGGYWCLNKRHTTSIQSARDGEWGQTNLNCIQTILSNTASL